MKLEIWWTVLSRMWYMSTWTPIFIVSAKSWRRSIRDLGIGGRQLWDVIILVVLGVLLLQLLLSSSWCLLYYKLYIQYKGKTIGSNPMSIDKYYLDYCLLFCCINILFCLCVFFFFFGRNCFIVLLINLLLRLKNWTCHYKILDLFYYNFFFLG